MPRKYKIWDKFNRLTIISNNIVDRYRYFRCDCWKVKKIQVSSVYYWGVKSCWCLQKEKNKIINKTHWLSKSNIYNIYRWIIYRCLDKKDKNYWGRWIKCEWKSFEEFYEDMWKYYIKWLTIERINVNWNYCKENCTWATKKQQSNNTRRNIYIEYNNITKTISEWADEYNINYYTLYSRIKRWMPLERALQSKKYRYA